MPRSPVPIVADIHHQYKMALAALDAGVHCLRLNPGNIRKPEHIKVVAQECKDRGIPIRIGVNGGSLDPALYEKHGGKVTPEAMVESAAAWSSPTSDEVGFDDVKISVKASSVPLMIEAYRQLADAVDHPLHLGVTEAGPPPAGLLKATAGMATLLAEGIGDTIRYSLTADPVEEARAGRQLLEAHGPARAQEHRPHRLPELRPRRDRRHPGRQGRHGGLRRPGDPAAGRGDGLRGERSRRGARRRPRHRGRQEARPPVREGPQRGRRPRGRDGVDARRVGRVHQRARRRRRRRPGRHREGGPRGREGPRRAARRSRATTPTRASRRSS